MSAATGYHANKAVFYAQLSIALYFTSLALAVTALMLNVAAPNVIERSEIVPVAKEETP